MREKNPVKVLDAYSTQGMFGSPPQAPTPKWRLATKCRNLATECGGHFERPTCGGATAACGK